MVRPQLASTRAELAELLAPTEPGVTGSAWCRRWVRCMKGTPR
nr:hypothetical protein [Nocardioides alcanivorans]